MGSVYLARNPELGRAVAIKVPRFDLSAPDAGATLQRFLREAHAAASVRHPNVCPIYDAGVEGSRPYAVMAYIEGESLAQRVSRGGAQELLAREEDLGLDLRDVGLGAVDLEVDLRVGGLELLDRLAGLFRPRSGAAAGRSGRETSRRGRAAASLRAGAVAGGALEARRRLRPAKSRNFLMEHGV